MENLFGSLLKRLIPLKKKNDRIVFMIQKRNVNLLGIRYAVYL
jgi:hypothetical protein